MNDDEEQHPAATVLWHRELPPLDADLLGEHTVEASSSRVAATISHREELWNRCYTELMANAEARLRQEVARLGGSFAHVHTEQIQSRHDDSTGETWLHGRFNYLLYRNGVARDISSSIELRRRPDRRKS